MELSTGGVAWIPNLTDVDHSLILPVLMGVTNLVITEVRQHLSDIISFRMLSKSSPVISAVPHILSGECNESGGHRVEAAVIRHQSLPICERSHHTNLCRSPIGESG